MLPDPRQAPPRRKRKVHTPAHPWVEPPPPGVLIGPVAQARLINTSRRTLERMVANGEIPFIKVGSRKKFDHAATLAALKEAGESE